MKICCSSFSSSISFHYRPSRSLLLFKKISSQKIQKKVDVRIPPILLKVTPPGKKNAPIYDLVAGCKEHGGVLVTDVGLTSFLRAAQPPLVKGVFLVEIDGTKVDEFGEARKKGFPAGLDDQVGVLVLLEGLGSGKKVIKKKRILGGLG